MVAYGERCLGHLSDPDFEKALRALRASGAEARSATISGERVDRLIDVMVTRGRPCDFTRARIEGDVHIRGGALDADVSFQAATIRGMLLVSGVSGIHRLRLDGLDEQRTSLAVLEILNCTGGEWSVDNVDVGRTAMLSNLELGLLEIASVRLGETAQIQDLRTERGLVLRDCAWDYLEIMDLKSSGDVLVTPARMDRLTLRRCECASRVTFRVCGPLDLLRCKFDDTLDVQWSASAAQPADVARDADLRLDSTHITSNANLSWGGEQISLVSTVFSAASRLERDARAQGDPTLVDVRQLDGEKLRIGQIDLHECQLARAATLGPIDSNQLPLGFGAAGSTRRHYLADEDPNRDETREERKARAPGLARTYRDLRTSCEEAGDHTSANDLHYGERLWERKASRMLSVRWLWLWLYGLFGYGVRPWRPLAALVVCVLLSALAFGLLEGLERQRTVRGTADDTIAALCDRGAPDTPAQRQVVLCPANAEERLEFSLRATTALIRPIGGYEVRGAAAVVDIALRLLAALFFGLFVLAVRNRVRR